MRLAGRVWSPRRRGWCSRSRSDTTSRRRRPINDAVGAVFEETADLPHRPLSGQGERAEPARHAGSPTRCSEPLWNSSWIDHVQITAAEVARRRYPRRLLRQVRRAARHAAEPPAAGAVPGRDGAADLHRSRDRARREAQGAAGLEAVLGQRHQARHGDADSTDPAWPMARWSARTGRTPKTRTARPRRS